MSNRIYYRYVGCMVFLVIVSIALLVIYEKNVLSSKKEYFTLVESLTQMVKDTEKKSPFKEAQEAQVGKGEKPVSIDDARAANAAKAVQSFTAYLYKLDSMFITDKELRTLDFYLDVVAATSKKEVGKEEEVVVETLLQNQPQAAAAI